MLIQYWVNVVLMLAGFVMVYFVQESGLCFVDSPRKCLVLHDSKVSDVSRIWISLTFHLGQLSLRSYHESWVVYSVIHNPGQKQLGHLSCFTHPPSVLENIAFFPSKREKSHLIINIESGDRGELTSCPKSCSKKPWNKTKTNLDLVLSVSPVRA